LRVDELAAAPLRGPRQPVAAGGRAAGAQAAFLAHVRGLAGGPARLRADPCPLRRASAGDGDVLEPALAAAGGQAGGRGGRAARESGASRGRTAFYACALASGATLGDARTAGHTVGRPAGAGAGCRLPRNAA